MKALCSYIFENKEMYGLFEYCLSHCSMRHISQEYPISSSKRVFKTQTRPEIYTANLCKLAHYVGLYSSDADSPSDGIKSHSVGNIHEWHLRTLDVVGGRYWARWCLSHHRWLNDLTSCTLWFCYHLRSSKEYMGVRHSFGDKCLVIRLRPVLEMKKLTG